MDVMNQLLAVSVNYKKAENIFCQATYFDF